MDSISREINGSERLLVKYSMMILSFFVVTAGGIEPAFCGETGTRGSHVGEATEMHFPTDQPLAPWIHDPAIFETDEGDTTETREAVEQEATTIKLNNLVPPIHFGLGEIEITEEYLKMLRVSERVRPD